MQKFTEQALAIAHSLNADYADIRIQKTTTENIALRNLSLKDTSHNTKHGYGVRIFKNGAWGFAHHSIFGEKEVVQTVKKAIALAQQSAKLKKGKGLVLAPERSYIDSYKTPYQIDPLCVPMNEKVEIMLETNKTLLNYDLIKQAIFWLRCRKDEKFFASSIGSHIQSETVFIEPMVIATANTETDSQSRSFREGGMAKGWEWFLSLNLLEKASCIAEEAIMKVKADSLETEERRDLLLDPIHLSLTMHESVGHPTELDRVLGWEADYAGISFATPEKLKTYQYGSPMVNFIADNTLEGGLATAGYDDEGVPNQKWHIIKDGILNEYGSTRDTIPFLGDGMSRGCARATDYFDTPINRIPNLYLQPGKEKLTPQDLISDTKNAIYIEGQGSFSIDQHRVNFQFGGDMFWEIKNGKKVRPLKKIIYRSNNPEFWNSVDAICDDRFFKTFGVTNCGKGQPNQSGRMTHGGALTRFRNITVGGTK